MKKASQLGELQVSRTTSAGLSCTSEGLPVPLSSTPTMTTLAHLTAQRDRFETRSIEDARNCGAISCRTWCNEFAGESGTRWRALIAGDARLEKSCPHGPGARTGGRYMPFAVGGVREKWGRGIDCPALTMRVEGLRERLQQLRCRPKRPQGKFIAQRFGALHSAKSRRRGW